MFTSVSSFKYLFNKNTRCLEYASLVPQSGSMSRCVRWSEKPWNVDMAYTETSMQRLEPGECGYLTHH